MEPFEAPVRKIDAESEGLRPLNRMGTVPFGLRARELTAWELKEGSRFDQSGSEQQESHRFQCCSCAFVCLTPVWVGRLASGLENASSIAAQRLHPQQFVAVHLFGELEVARATR